MSTTDDLREVLARHADDVPDHAPERVQQLRSRVRTARRRRRGAGAVLAAVLVAATAGGVATYVDRADAPQPAEDGRDGLVLLTEGGSGQGLNDYVDHIDVPGTALRLEYWCPSGAGWVTIDVNGHRLLAPTECPAQPESLTTEAGGIDLPDGTVVKPGEIAEIRMRLLDRPGDTQVSQRPDGKMKLRVWKVADPRVPRIGDRELAQTVQSAPDVDWELVEVRPSEPGAREAVIEVEPDTLVSAVVGYRAQATLSGGGSGTTEFSGPTSLVVSRFVRGEMRPVVSGGRFVLRLTEEPDPDGLIGFALYRRTG